jgi:hypothetical protein
MGGPQSLSGRGGEEKNSQPLSGLEPPIIQPVAQRYTTELSRILSKNRKVGLNIGVQEEVLELLLLLKETL